MLEKEEVKTLIWRLDATLVTFGGVDWMENVGRVARLKEGFFRCTTSAKVDFRPLSSLDREALDRCLDVLDRAGSSPRLCRTAFDAAARLISSLLPDDPAQRL